MHCVFGVSFTLFIVCLNDYVLEEKNDTTISRINVGWLHLSVS